MTHDPYTSAPMNSAPMNSAPMNSGPSDAPQHVEPDPELAGYPPPLAPAGWLTDGWNGGPAQEPGWNGGQPGATGWYPSGPPSGQWQPNTQHAGGLQPTAPYYGGPQPNPWPSPDMARTKPSPMPDSPREYHQMLRGPRHRWWRPLLALLLAVAIAFPLMLLAFLPVILAGVIVGVDNPAQWAAVEVVKTKNLGPAGFLYVNLSLVTLIPAAGLSIWLAHRIRPRYLASVAGGLRWRWLLRCVVVVVPVFALYLGISALIDTPTSPRPAHWVLLLVIVVCLTPFQAAGEEYFFRGWIMQSIGSWFKHPLVGLVVTLVVSIVAFSAAHGSPDPWVLGSLGVFALTAGIATWRTGGLEAGIVIHAVNNIGVFFTVILLGGWQEAFVSANSTSTPIAFLITLGVHAVTLALILWQAKRAGIQRLYCPEATKPRLQIEPMLPGPYPPGPYPNGPAGPGYAPTH